MNRIIATLGALLLALTVVFGTGVAASAHTPGHTADCEAVTGSMTNTPDTHNSTITVTVGTESDTSTSGGNHSVSVPVPQGGATTEWSVVIDGDGEQYDADWSGTVGPCGEVHDECPDLPGDQPEGFPCSMEPEVTEDSSTALDCDDEVQVTTTVVTTTEYVFDEQTQQWVLGEPVSETSTSEQPVEPGDCDETEEPPTEEPPVEQPPTEPPAVPTVVDSGR
jgi:hypothetical protein